MSGSEIGALLQRSALFRDLPDDVLATARDAASLLMTPPKATLFRQGDAPEQLIMVGKGFVKMMQTGGDGESSTIRIMGPGDVIGCVAVFRQEPYPATATTIVDSLLLSWPATWILGLMEQCPKARANGLDLVGRRAGELVHRLHAMATEPVERRIAHVLLQLAALAGHTAGQGTQIGFPLSRQDVAEIVGTDLYVVSRVLRRWADQRLLSAGRLRIAVLDPERIEQIANGVPDAM